MEIDSESSCDSIIINCDFVNKKYYLYQHARADTNRIFYIGIGTCEYKGYYGRACNFKNRSGYWKRVANKYRYNIEIIEEFDNRKECLAREVELIKLYGRRKLKTGELVNFTEGGKSGNGRKGYKISKELSKKFSKIRTGMKGSESKKQKMKDLIYKRTDLIGRKGKDSYVAKAVLKLNPITNIIVEEFGTVKEASKSINMCAPMIGKAIKSKEIYKDFKWVFKKDYYGSK
jgi:hypothetical protein